MSGLRRWAVGCVLVLGFAAPGAAQARRPVPKAAPATVAPAPADIRVRSHLTQTAAWVGDPVDFVIEIEAAPGVELVEGDLAADKLVVDGLERGEVQTTTATRADGWRTFRRTYRVTPWDVTPPKEIEPLTVRFRRPVSTATADNTSEAAELIVPGAALAVRSTLPDDGRADGVRDRAAGLGAPAWLASLRPVGLGLVALGIAPVVLWLIARATRPRVARPRVSTRSLQAALTSMFNDVRIIDTGTADGRRRAYDRLDTDLRAYVVQAATVPAAALTADELRVRLADSHAVPVEPICNALAECEVARYGPESRLPDADAVRATIERLELALGRRRA